MESSSSSNSNNPLAPDEAHPQIEDNTYQGNEIKEENSEIFKILDDKTDTEGKSYLLIWWTGCSKHYSSWEPEEILQLKHRELIDNYFLEKSKKNESGAESGFSLPQSQNPSDEFFSSFSFQETGSGSQTHTDESPSKKRRMELSSSQKDGTVTFPSQVNSTTEPYFYAESDVDDGLVSAMSFAIPAVYFTCNELGLALAPLYKLQQEMLLIFLDMPKERKIEAACLAIYSLNRDTNTVTECVECLKRVLGNIIRNPSNPMFHQIRKNTATFQNRLAGVKGIRCFLETAGFEKKAYYDKEEWTYRFEIKPAFINISDLETMLVSMQTVLPIPIQIHRNKKVLTAIEEYQAKVLPAEFFGYSTDELKEYSELNAELHTEFIETKKKPEKTIFYRYALMRIRFPCGLTLQGTFEARETVTEIFQFVKENLVDENISFSLLMAGQNVLLDHTKTLAEMNFAPGNILYFHAEQPKDLQQSSGKQFQYLKHEN